MEKSLNGVKVAIKGYLDERARTDELFARCYAKEGKSLDECVAFIVGEARKRGSAVCMTDAEVFGLAVHYYDEDGIVVAEVPDVCCGSVAEAGVVLSDEERASVREEALEAYRRECMAEFREAERRKARRLSERRKAKGGDGVFAGMLFGEVDYEAEE